MDIVKIKNNGNPVIVGDVVLERGQVTPVDRSEMIKYLKTISGSFNFENFMDLISGDLPGVEVKKVVQTSVGNTEVLKKRISELEVKISESDDIISNLKAINSKLEEKVEWLNGIVSDVSISEDVGGDSEDHGPEDVANFEEVTTPENDEDAESSSLPFPFDPEKHHVEHRGGGHWYVMDGEEKVHAIANDAERKRYEDLAR